MTDEMKKKRDELAEKILSESAYYLDKRVETVAFKLGFDACHELMQAKLDVAVKALEFMIDSWMSGTVTQYEIRKRAEEALEKLK